ncbi:MAG: ABC transporter permease, partial [Lachnospiraceae bacterium]|nr:ABC transporter permease [Lachnospiraceae bacterium]
MNTDKKSLLHRILYFVLPVLLVTFWEVYSRKGLISQAIFPMPSKLVEAFKKLLDNGRLWSNLSISLQRVLKGFAFGSIIGILVGILMGLFRGINSLLSSLVSIFRPIPIVAWIPLFIVLMGIGEKPKVTMIAVGAFWPLLLNTIHGIQTVDRKLIDMARIHQKSKVEILFKIILPSALPSIFTGMKLGIATSWSA